MSDHLHIIQSRESNIWNMKNNYIFEIYKSRYMWHCMYILKEFHVSKILNKIIQNYIFYFKYLAPLSDWKFEILILCDFDIIFTKSD